MNKINTTRTGKFAPTILAAFLAFALTFTLFACSDDNDDDGGTSSGTLESSSSTKVSSSSSSKTNVLVDSRDSKEYRTVKIGNQTWMAENLNFGTPSGSYCYNNNNSNCEKYGRLYNWTAAMNACPAGWHLPSDAEWTALRLAVGGTGAYGTEGAAGTKLKATSGWNSNGNGTDDYGFSALPGGRGRSSSNFDLAGSDGGWWSASEITASEVWNMSMNYGRETAGRYGNNKTYFQSVRCLKDSEEVPLSSSLSNSSSSVKIEISSSSEITIESCSNIEYGTDSFTCGGQTYKTVVIGTQTWMAENLNWETGESWCYGDIASNCDKYGRLYTQTTAMNACPSGWHLSSKGDWNVLTDFAGEYIAGEKLKSATEWDGTDDFGFSALPGGRRFPPDIFYRYIGSESCWWSNLEGLCLDSDRLIVSESGAPGTYGFYARCVKD